MSNKNNEQLIDYVAKNSHILKKDVAIALKLIVAGITETVKGGYVANVSGLGRFAQIRVKARVRRHPATQLPFVSPAKKKPKFVAATAFEKKAGGH